MSQNKSNQSTDPESCVVGLSRQEFIKQVLNRAVIGGAILVVATEITMAALAPIRASASTTTTGT